MRDFVSANPSKPCAKIITKRTTVAALRRHTPDVRVGSGCVAKEVKTCDHHEMVATSYGIYPLEGTWLHDR